MKTTLYIYPCDVDFYMLTIIQDLKRGQNVCIVSLDRYPWERYRPAMDEAEAAR